MRMELVNMSKRQAQARPKQQISMAYRFTCLFSKKVVDRGMGIQRLNGRELVVEGWGTLLEGRPWGVKYTRSRDYGWETITGGN